MFKGPRFYCQRLPDLKILWHNRNLEEVWSFLKYSNFVHEIFYKSYVNVGKMKISKNPK